MSSIAAAQSEATSSDTRSIARAKTARELGWTDAMHLAAELQWDRTEKRRATAEWKRDEELHRQCIQHQWYRSSHSYTDVELADALETSRRMHLSRARETFVRNAQAKFLLAGHGA